ncbi:MAG: DUF2254 domain-containing protein [Rhodocyclaceae bacterium]
MGSFMSAERLRFVFNRFRERLWVKPLGVCLLSIAAVFLASLADGTSLARLFPRTAVDSLETLLSIMASSMLVIATFSVGSMVAAYNAASSSATPRSFGVVVADDVSQNALSTFIGAFIFSIVAITAVKNNGFEAAGLFVLFVLTALVFALVIFTFVRWVDRIARLGRMGSTIDKVEAAAADALQRRRRAPTLGGVPAEGAPVGQAVFAPSVGYVQQIDMYRLQAWAEQAGRRVRVVALPGAFLFPGRALAYVPGPAEGVDHDEVAAAFDIGDERLFDDDPRFGLVVLSEIAGRALSPGVNDPGTAIDVIGTLVRLFALWRAPCPADEPVRPIHDRVAVPGIDIADMFDDAFTAIGRDGADTVEVVLRLLKALHALAEGGDVAMAAAARWHARRALACAESRLPVAVDLARVREAGAFAGPLAMRGAD